MDEASAMFNSINNWQLSMPTKISDARDRSCASTTQTPSQHGGRAVESQSQRDRFWHHQELSRKPVIGIFASYLPGA
jgi:hypothetical protein